MYMNTRITTYGKITGIAGQNIPAPGIPDTDALRTWLQQQFPALAQQTYYIAVNHIVIYANTTLPAGAVVALLPPFSGG